MTLNPFNIYCSSDHFLETGQIKVSNGSLQDCNKALHHYDKMLVEAKFLSRPGKFNENEFVKFWYNCHTIFNSYDLSKFLFQIDPFMIEPLSKDPFNCIFLSKQWPCYRKRI